MGKVLFTANTNVRALNDIVKSDFSEFDRRVLMSNKMFDDSFDVLASHSLKHIIPSKYPYSRGGIRLDDYQTELESRNFSSHLFIVDDFMNAFAFTDKGNKRLVNYLVLSIASPHTFIWTFDRDKLIDILDKRSSYLYSNHGWSQELIETLALSDEIEFDCNKVGDVFHFSVKDSEFSPGKIQLISLMGVNFKLTLNKL